ncbi:MAG: diaminopimelate decarboxylase [Planctomycetota bacterium]
MQSKTRILNDETLAALAREHGTPLYVYDASIVARRVAELSTFDVVRYAQKANSNLSVLDLVRRAGCVVDAVSAGEIARAIAAGFAPRDITFTADLFDRAALEWVARHDVPVNLGSRPMIEQYAVLVRERGLARRDVMLRVNPGFGHGHGNKVNTGGAGSKHGIWHEDLAEAVAHARALGLRVSGLHVHIGSGSDLEHLSRVGRTLRALAAHARDTLERISAGGGLPIPYRPGDARLDVEALAATWRATRDAIAGDLDRAIEVEVEPGRYLVAEAGALIAEVRGTKTNGGVEYVLVDAGFHNLVRPAMYGAYHHISVLGRAVTDAGAPKVVAGPLCESADVFTQDKEGRVAPLALPDVKPGDLVCIHDAGAYASSMGSNYNSQPLAAEVLVEDGRARLVRRRQTIEEMLELERDPS